MSARRRSPPSQKALALPDWPKADRETWQTAQETAGALDDGGAASHLNALARQDLTRRYAYFLSFLAHQGKLDLQEPAAATVTDANILHYLRYLEPHVSSVTLAQSLYKIARVAHCLAPGRDWRWLRRLRLANITALELGRTLIKDGTTWSFNIPPEETKAGRLHLAVLPDWSASRIDRYVEHYRLFFRNAESTNRLWLSQLGRPLAYSSLYGLICKRTRDAFGKRINPHPFRSCLATSTAIYHGAEIGLAMTVLEHTSSEVFERYYNQAKMIDAVKAYQEILLANPQG